MDVILYYKMSSQDLNLFNDYINKDSMYNHDDDDGLFISEDTINIENSNKIIDENLILLKKQKKIIIQEVKKNNNSNINKKQSICYKLKKLKKLFYISNKIFC
jgi:hypothetical protein